MWWVLNSLPIIVDLVVHTMVHVINTSQFGFCAQKFIRYLRSIRILRTIEVGGCIDKCHNTRFSQCSNCDCNCNLNVSYQERGAPLHPPLNRSNWCNQSKWIRIDPQHKCMYNCYFYCDCMCEFFLRFEFNKNFSAFTYYKQTLFLARHFLLHHLVVVVVVAFVVFFIFVVIFVIPITKSSNQCITAWKQEWYD